MILNLKVVEVMNLDNLLMIDPQSLGTMGSYDYNLLSNMQLKNKVLIGNKKFEYQDSDKIEFIPYFNYTNKILPLKIFSFLKSYIKLLNYIRTHKLQIIHYQWLRIPKLEYFILKLIKKINPDVKLFFTAHNILPHDTGLKYLNIFKKIYKIFDGVIVHTSSSKNKLSELGVEKDKIYVIPHGTSKLKIDESIYEKKIESLKNKINKKSQKIVFGFLGTISNYKGIDMLLKTWESNKFLCDNREIKLVIAGKVSSYDKGKLYNSTNKCKNIYTDIRRLTNEEFQAYLKLCDVILLPYEKISQSGILLSAIHEQKPVVVSEVGGLTDPFKFGKIGWKFKKNSNKEFEEVLKHIINNPNSILNIKNDLKSWSRLKRIYSWENIAQKTIKAYEDIYF